MSNKKQKRLINQLADAIYAIRPHADGKFCLDCAMHSFGSLFATKACYDLLNNLNAINSDKRSELNNDFYRELLWKGPLLNELAAAAGLFTQAIIELPLFTDIIRSVCRRLHARYGVNADAYIEPEIGIRAHEAATTKLVRNVKMGAVEMPTFGSRGNECVGSVALAQLRAVAAHDRTMLESIDLVVISDHKIGMTLAMAQVMAWFATFPSFDSVRFTVIPGDNTSRDDVLVIGKDVQLVSTSIGASEDKEEAKEAA